MGTSTNIGTLTPTISLLAIEKKSKMATTDGLEIVIYIHYLNHAETECRPQELLRSLSYVTICKSHNQNNGKLA